MCRKQIVLTFALVLAPASAWAQSGSLFGNNGTASRRGTSSSGLNSNRANPTNTGGNAGGAITGFTGQTAGTAAGFFETGGSTFVGQSGSFAGNRNASNSALGGGMQGGVRGGATAARGTTQRGGVRQQSFARGGNTGNRNSRNQGLIGQGMTGMANSARTVQAQQRIAFPVARPPVTEVHTAVTTSLANVPDSRFQGLTVQLDPQGVVTLRGKVASDDDRKLAEAMARLEPGVREVANELTVTAE